MNIGSGHPKVERAGPCFGSGDGDLLAALNGLLGDASRALVSLPAHAGRVAQLADYISEIRHLLSELCRYSPRRGGAGITPGQCRELVERYRDLEGIIKERRNDLAASPHVRAKGGGI